MGPCICGQMKIFTASGNKHEVFSLLGMGVIGVAAMFRFTLALCLSLGLAVFAYGQTVDFDKQIRPLLQQHCHACHSGKISKNGLRLDNKTHAMAGSTDGPVIVPGKSATSALLKRITSEDPATMMPPKGPRLSRSQVDLIRTWIDEGATWPQTEAERALARDPRLDHWAWQPLVSVPSTGIDSFIDAKLKASNIAPGPRADRHTLIRRLSFDLLGLPPSPEEVAAFEKDPDPNAYARLVDRYLASPRYGERQARQWLDIAHYADTHGFERDQKRENAWRYRDWLIRAFNSDMPYDRFLTDQLAGDFLRPNDPEAVTATGFLAAGPWDFVGQAETPSPVLKRLARADDLDDMITQVMAATCGVTINCARCHDHKLDPISQREYYALAAVFSGVRRGDRPIDVAGDQKRTALRQTLVAEREQLQVALGRLEGRGLNLADIVGGGNGLGSGKAGTGISAATGKPLANKQGYVAGVVANRFVSVGGLIDGVVVPGGGDVPIASSGILAKNIGKTTAGAWDAIRNGPVNDQKSTTITGINYASSGHSLLGLHANAAITFDLQPMREVLKTKELVFRAAVGYGGRPADGSGKADVRVLLDGQPLVVRMGIGPSSEDPPVELPIPMGVRYLTLMATEGADGTIGHDQVYFGDPRVAPAVVPGSSAADAAERSRLAKRLRDIEGKISKTDESPMVYGVRSSPPDKIHLLRRGNPEEPGAVVGPDAINCLKGAPVYGGQGAIADGERRAALARWIVHPDNPLTRRVIVNRLWHHHFGIGIVDTPSDFGAGGGKPSHPEMLDWLAGELLSQKWSLKSIHRLICISEAYQRASVVENPAAKAIDASNRLLWRQNPRRLDAESVRDAVLATSGQLDLTLFGPGFRDFVYTEAYAPIYRHVDDDSPGLRRRSIYRFVVRTTPQPFLTTLDCANPANLTPARNETTTALQSLALLNNPFMLRQARHFADRVKMESGDDAAFQARRAFIRALGRLPDQQESGPAADLIRSRGLPELCRMLFNTSEFSHVD